MGEEVDLLVNNAGFAGYALRGRTEVVDDLISVHVGLPPGSPGQPCRAW